MSILCRAWKESFARIYFTSLSFLCIECVSETEKSDKNVWSGESRIFFNISASIEINSALGIFHLLYVIFESIKISSKKKILPRNLLILRRHWIDEKCVSWCLTDNATQWMMMSHFRFFLLSSDRFIDDDDDLSLASCSILKMNFCDSLNDDIEWQKKIYKWRRGWMRD